MPRRKSIAEEVTIVIASSKSSEKKQSYQNYRDHLKTRGLLKEDSYNWSLFKPVKKKDVELIGRPSKNYLLNQS
jgi:hypothetical protein